MLGFFFAVMINTIYYTNKNFIIPSNKIFEKIFNLKEKLTGQSIKIKSIFNENDNTPSMVIYFCEEDNMYRFKDFSTGLYGDAIDIINEQYQLEDRQKAFRKVIELFKHDTDIKLINIINKEKKEVNDYVIRKWTDTDAEFWKQFGIGGSFLKTYNIKPLDSFCIKISNNNTESLLSFDCNMSYGYFNNTGDLCKIYQPGNKKAKFLKVKEYIQGIDQLTYTKKCLIIASSLKDIGAFKSLKYNNIELIAPDSENVTITQDKLDMFKTKYEYVFTMFDNDAAGIQAMNKYKKLYGIDYIYFNIEKDVAECVKQHGIKNTKAFFKPIFLKLIKKEKNK